MSTIQKLQNFYSIGSFSTNDDVIRLSVPVPSSDFKIANRKGDFKSLEIYNVSNASATANVFLNVLLVRVTNGLDDCQENEPKNLISHEIKISDYHFDEAELSNAKKLIVVVLHSITPLESPEIIKFKSDISKVSGYDDTDEIANLIRYGLEDCSGFKPNQRKGSILQGL
jgi:hypothetical protein